MHARKILHINQDNERQYNTPHHQTKTNYTDFPADNMWTTKRTILKLTRNKIIASNQTIKIHHHNHGTHANNIHTIRKRMETFAEPLPEGNLPTPSGGHQAVGISPENVGGNVGSILTLLVMWNGCILVMLGHFDTFGHFGSIVCSFFIKNVKK